MAGNEEIPQKSTRKGEQARTRRKKAAMLRALTKSFGVVADACDAVKIDRKTHYNWLKDDPEFRENVESINERALDFAETKLLRLIREKNPQAILFLLETRGKKRGYIKKSETEHSGAITIPLVTFKVPAELTGPTKSEAKKTS